MRTDRHTHTHTHTHTEGRTDRHDELTVAFRNFANAPKVHTVY